VDRWTGTELITFGNVAFDWFRLAFPQHKTTIQTFWRRPDRYEATCTLDLGTRSLHIRPLPHPSPLNATWYRHLPALLDQRLAETGVDARY
jgi:uracil-DNA glycosylase